MKKELKFPYEEGTLAAGAGYDIEFNPYQEGTDEFEEWNVGWTDAHMEDDQSIN